MAEERTAGNGVRTFVDLIGLLVDNDDSKYKSVMDLLDSRYEMAKFLWQCARTGLEEVIGIILATAGLEIMVAVPLGLLLMADGWVRLKRYTINLADRAMAEAQSNADRALDYNFFLF